MIGMGKRAGDLYVLENHSSPHNVQFPVHDIQFPSTAYSFNVVNNTLWHFRLGHPSNAKLQCIKELGHVNLHSSNIPCDVCHLAKQKRLPSTSSNKVADSLFDIIHCDIWGLFHVPTINKQRYFLSIVDDHSRATWVYLLKAKSEVVDLIPVFYNMIATQFNIPVKILRSDNGPEFNLFEFYKEKGIIHQLSCVDTPQQNSIVERKHQHLLNVVRAIRFQSNASLNLWGECVLTAGYLINRLPSLVLKNKSPFELLFKKKPVYDHFKVFGCLCYASTLASHRHKFAEIARKCVFIGYPFGVKGYKLLDLDSRKIFISRDVVFHETILPFQNSIPNQDPFLDVSLPMHILNEGSSLTSNLDITNVSRNNADTEISQTENPIEIQNNPIMPVTIQSQPRKSTRVHKKPAYLKSYHCHLVSNLENSKILYPLTSVVNSSKLSPTYKALVASISSQNEPETYH